MKKLRSGLCAPEQYITWSSMLPYEAYSPLCDLGGMFWWEYFSTLEGIAE